MTLEFKYREKFNEGKAEGALSMLLRLAKDGRKCDQTTQSIKKQQ